MEKASKGRAPQRGYLVRRLPCSNPVFHIGTPDSAAVNALHAVNKSYSTIAASREAEARQFAAIPGVDV